MCVFQNEEQALAEEEAWIDRIHKNEEDGEQRAGMEAE